MLFFHQKKYMYNKLNLWPPLQDGSVSTFFFCGQLQIHAFRISSFCCIFFLKSCINISRVAVVTPFTQVSLNIVVNVNGIHWVWRFAYWLWSALCDKNINNSYVCLNQNKHDLHSYMHVICMFECEYTKQYLFTRLKFSSTKREYNMLRKWILK